MAKPQAKKAVKDSIVVVTKENGRNAPAGTSTDKTDKPGKKEGGKESSESRVMYIGHIPHGFYEKQLLEYFNQFGKVTRVRLSRNKKTAKSKGYAFVEFQFPEVAQIASDTMNGYLMLGQKLQCRVVPVEQQHPQLWKGANRSFKKIPWASINRERVNKERTPAEQAARQAKLIKKDKKRKQKIEAAGIEYEYKGYESTVQPKAKKIKFED